MPAPPDPPGDGRRQAPPPPSPPTWGSGPPPPPPANPPAWGQAPSSAAWSTPAAPRDALTGYPPTAPPGAPTEEGSLALAVMGGLAGAVVAGLAWWAIVATTRMQVTIAAIAVGWVVAQAVLVCCTRHNRLPLQAIAGVFTLGSLAISEYFIQRTLFIKDFEELSGTGPGIPLWDGFGSAREIVTDAIKDDPITGLFWIGAVIAALVVAGTQDAITNRR